jgi:hypothetical protein
VTAQRVEAAWQRERPCGVSGRWRGSVDRGGGLPALRQRGWASHALSTAVAVSGCGACRERSPRAGRGGGCVAAVCGSLGDACVAAVTDGPRGEVGGGGGHGWQ